MHARLHQFSLLRQPVSVCLQPLIKHSPVGSVQKGSRAVFASHNSHGRHIPAPERFSRKNVYSF
jgi:hypothetical protein